MNSQDTKEGELEKSINQFDKIRNQMKNLPNVIGQVINVKYIWYGSAYYEEGVLKKVNPFVNIKVGDQEIPFINYKCAIQKIFDNKGNLFYENPRISDDYNEEKNLEIETLITKTFGKNALEKIKKYEL